MKKTIISLLIMASAVAAYAFDQTVTIPAEKSEGVVLSLPKGNYKVEVAGGAVALFFPINPEYSWLYSLAIGTDCKGGQDEPNVGTLYVEPQSKATSQADAETAIMQALKEGQTGTKLAFTLKEKKDVRFWVSDFDYSDNMGSERVRIYSVK
jgi:hypothetical protein